MLVIGFLSVVIIVVIFITQPKEKSLRKKQLEFFEDTVKYYNSPEKFCYAGSRGCKYHAANLGKEDESEGCAIGRHLSPELQKAFDALGNSSVGSSQITVIHNNHPEMYAKMPEKLKKLGLKFLQAVQTWHDNQQIESSEAFKEKIIKGEYL